MKNFKVIEHKDFKYRPSFFQDYQDNFCYEIGDKCYIYDNRENPSIIFADIVERSLEDFLQGSLY